MRNILLIFIGGGIGSAIRFWMSHVWLRTNGTFPVGTLAVNLTGCFVIGCCWALAERGSWPMAMQNFLFIGLLGGFTTFSAFGLETISLLRAGEVRHAVLNVGLSNALGILLVFFGFWLIRTLSR